MAINLHASQQALFKIFSDDFAFEIPPYQRPYAWTTEQAGELLSDLWSFVEGSTTPIEEMRPYFLGSIVLIKGDNPKADVVDGQQRLTTLTILISCLRQTLPTTDASHLTSFLYTAGNPYTGTQNSYRVRLRPRDAQFFLDNVQSEAGLKNISQIDVSALIDSQKNICANANYFLEKLAALSDNERISLSKFMMQRCFLVVVSTPDFDSAYRIFSVLNTRGLELGLPDIIKADVIGGIPSSLQDQYTQVWEDKESELGREGFKDLFAHIRTIYVKTKQRGAILNEFRAHVKPTANPRDFVDSVLSPYAESLENIKFESYSGPQSKEVNSWFRWLNMIDNQDWIPPALVFLARNKVNGKDVEKFFDLLETLAASLFIRRADVNERIERYSSLIRWMETSKNVFDASSPLQLKPEEKLATIQELQGDIYLVRRTRLYILLRLDSALSAGGVSYTPPIITVEHVLPQTVSGGAWAKDFPTKSIREQWVHKIANLVLLTRRKNSQAQNYNFDKKKNLYFIGSGGTTTFALTNRVLSHLQWTPTELAKEQDFLIATLKTLWNL